MGGVVLNRRHFLQHSSVLLAAGLVPQFANAARSDRARRLHMGTQTNTFGVPIKDYDRLLAILDALRQLGYQGFETNYLSLDAQAGRASECRKAFASRDVRLVALHTDGRLWDRQKTPAEVEGLRRIAGYSAQMGATHLIMSAHKLPHPDGKVDLEQVHAVMEGLNAVGRMCRQEGLKFCYHNHIQEFQDEPSEMSFILKETDPKLVWLNYDVGNAYPIGPKPGDFSAEHFRRIAVYHIKDVDQGPDGKVVPTDLGAGKIDLKAVVAPLLDSNWEGWLTVEREGAYPKPAEHPEELLKQCRGYLKQITSV